MMLLVYLAPRGFAGDATICRSAEWEQKFREIAAGSVEILAVCPRKNSFIIEIYGKESDISIFKQLTSISDLRVTSIEDMGESLKTGAKLLKIEYSY